MLVEWGGNPARIPGLRGVVGDVLTAPRELRPALEAGLGPVLSALVVSSVEDARAALALFGREPRGSVTFVPVSAVRAHEPPAVPGAVASDPAPLGRAVDRLPIAGQGACRLRAGPA